MDEKIKFADAMARACQAASVIGYENAQVIVIDRRFARVSLIDHVPDARKMVGKSPMPLWGAQIMGALKLARDGYISEAASGQPVLEAWRESTVRKLNVAIDTLQRLRANGIPGQGGAS